MPVAAPALDDQHWQPATLRERGVAVPFTSPMLAGARVRLLERRHDLVLPHPGGGRGVYVLALTSLREFCAPTLHDLRLAELVAAAPALSPASVRQAARAVAAEGLAGRPARAAAAVAEAAQAATTAAFETLLLAALCQSSGAVGQDGDPAQRTRAALHQMAQRIGRAPDAVRSDIARLAAGLAEAGLDLPALPGALPAPGRCRRLLAALGTMAADIRAAADAGGGQEADSQVADAAEAMQQAGRLVLEAAQRPLAEPAALLACWATTPDAIAARISRPDWLLDGWEPICLLWRVTEGGQRAGALAEAALMLPPIPPELDAWFATAPALQARLRARAAAGALPRAGGRVPSQAVALTERNEHMRALAA